MTNANAANAGNGKGRTTSCLLQITRSGMARRSTDALTAKVFQSLIGAVTMTIAGKLSHVELQQKTGIGIHVATIGLPYNTRAKRL